MPLSTGYILNNRYRIVRLLGQGGFGAVYRAWDVNLEMPCAIKENFETSSEAARQFLREAQILHTLRHPNLPLVKDHFVIPGQGQYLVMDYIEGQDLQEKIAAGEISISQAVAWVLQICEALIYMHTQSQPVIHRDIKPANIKITPEGRAVLVDFGIAKVFDAKSRTTAGARAVTAGYSPFEQYGSAPTDGRTDLYALGATLYALLTGQEPAESIARVAGAELTPPRAINPEISQELEQVLLKTLEVMPAGRYQSVVDFKAALMAALGVEVSLIAQPSSTPISRIPLGMQTISVDEQAATNRPPSTPHPGRPPSQPRPIESISPDSAPAKKPLPMKWIYIGGAALLLLICTPLTIFGVSQLVKPAAVVATRPTATDAPTRIVTNAPEPTEVPEPTQEVAPDELTSGIDCFSPDILCVGVVKDVSPLYDGSFNQMAWEGVLSAESDFGAHVEYIETMDASQYYANIALFADNGYDIIITVGFILGEATNQAANTYPESYFIGVDQSQSEPLSNLAGLVFYEDQSGFLAGALAASLSRTGVIAGVYGSDMIPPVVMFSEGYANGAQYIDPNIIVLTTFHPGGLDVAFADPEWGAGTAAQAIQDNADVIFAAGGLTGSGALIETAAHPDIFCIGVDSDQWNTVPEAQPCLVSSAMKRVDLGIYELIYKYAYETAYSGNYYGQSGLASFHDFASSIPADTLAMLRSLESELGTSSPGLQESLPSAPADIIIWHQWDGDYLNAIQVVFDDYMAAHPNITISLERPDNVSDALQVAIPAGEGPDIIGWANDQIGTQALVGNIIDFNSLGVTMNELTRNFEPAAVNGVVWQGSIWGLPESQEGIALVYDTALASASDFPSDPFDFQGLLQSAEAYYNRTGRYLVCNQALGSPDAYHAAPIWFGFGMPSYVDDAGNVYMNTPEALAAANWLVQFSAFHPSETSHEICKTMLIEGQTAAWWTGPWAIADLEAAGIDYAILPMGRPFVGIKTLMITSNAADRGNAEVALDIIRFFTNEYHSTLLALTNGTIPANTAALNNPDVQSLESVAGFGASLNLGIPMANTPFSGAQWDPVDEATTAIWFGIQSPTDALAAAQRAIEEAIASMR